MGLILLSLWGCSNQPLYSTASSEQLSPVLDSYPLLPPAEIPAAILLKQRVTLSIKGQQRQFLVISKFSTERIVLVALLPTGQKLFTLDYDGIELKQESLAPVEIPTRDILAIMQFALWPETSVKQHYAQSQGWITLFSSNQRELRRASGSLLKISYHPQGLTVDNTLHGYQVEIYTLEKVDL